MPPFVTPGVSPPLAFQAQVDLAGLAPHGRPLPHTWRVPVGALAEVAVGDVAGPEAEALVVAQALLPVELLLAARALQAAALVTLEHRLVRPAARVALLAQQPRVQALLCWRGLRAHTQGGRV